ncbi:MAG: hypothetical protein LBL00_04535 [Endomicrobium sp.]|jgi:hypothetical protein|nr:hypothetical protein [Endomicrobium sp.]
MEILTILGGLIGGIIPALTKWFNAKIEAKQKQTDADIEIRKIEAAEKAKAAGIIAQADSGVDIERLKLIAEQERQTTGVKAIDVSVKLIRPLFGYVAVAMWTTSAVIAITVFKETPLSLEIIRSTFVMVVAYYFAERSIKKSSGG